MPATCELWMPLTGTPVTVAALKLTATCISSGRLMTMVGKPPPCMSKTSRVYPATAVHGRIRKTLSPLTPLPRVNRTGAGGGEGTELGEAESRGLALGEA